MEDQFTRTRMLLGGAVDDLWNKRVAVFGVGGVGGYVCEVLARSGIGTIDIIDNDQVSISNLNRQIIATHATVGMDKVQAMKERILSINPDIQVNAHQCFFLPENADTFHFEEYDYVVDAVDTVAAKISIILKAQAANVPVISAMGAGNKLDPTRFKVADIYETEMDRLAKVMRHELKKRGVSHLKVVYSDEKPTAPLFQPEADAQAADSTQEIKAAGSIQSEDSADSIKAPRRRQTPGSLAFVPAVAGCIIGGEVVKDLTGVNGTTTMADVLS